MSFSPGIRGSQKFSEEKENSFWEDTGRDFPLLCDAPSTSYYFECEKLLFERYFPDFGSKKVVKTDLWDEAKNSRILRWAAEQGAEVYGFDLSSETLKQALDAFEQAPTATRPCFIVSDVRKIGFANDYFDYLYSMGTVEHSPQYRTAVAECFRVLKPGGRAIIGVPNKLDPFLRPTMVACLSKVGLYSYGYELSFTWREWNRILVETGFRVLDNSGILFMPGLLRMADLYLHCYTSSGTVLTSPLVAPFAALYRRFPALRRHGYLIATVVQKP